jgi:hypothetical protein
VTGAGARSQSATEELEHDVRQFQTGLCPRQESNLRHRLARMAGSATLTP